MVGRATVSSTAGSYTDAVTDSAIVMAQPQAVVALIQKVIIITTVSTR